MLLGFAENKCSLFLKAAENSMPTMFEGACKRSGGRGPLPQYTSYYPRRNTFFPASSPREVSVTWRTTRGYKTVPSSFNSIEWSNMRISRYPVRSAGLSVNGKISSQMCQTQVN